MENQSFTEYLLEIFFDFCKRNFTRGRRFSNNLYWLAVNGTFFKSTRQCFNDLKKKKT